MLALIVKRAVRVDQAVVYFARLHLLPAYRKMKSFRTCLRNIVLTNIFDIKYI